MKRLKTPKILALGGIIAAVSILGLAFLLSAVSTKQGENIVVQNNPEVAARFANIQDNSNSACYGIKTVMAMDDNGRIMGSCCGPMNLHTYSEQLEALKEYSAYDFIPADPYDISVSGAKELINDFKTIQLSSGQQAIYEGAKKLSHEGGPCCCGDDNLESNTCWRWKVYGGVAKRLITENNFDSAQVAHVWDISDGCGGDHHVGGMHETA